jgi:hypothetical protein
MMRIDGGRDKGDITVIGGVSDDGELLNWNFDCKGNIPVTSIELDGSVRYAGWTVEELRQITEMRDD